MPNNFYKSQESSLKKSFFFFFNHCQYSSAIKLALEKCSIWVASCHLPSTEMWTIGDLKLVYAETTKKLMRVIDQRPCFRSYTCRDGLMASLTQWTWVGARSRRWWRTGKPGEVQPVGSQRVVLSNWRITTSCSVPWPLSSHTVIGCHIRIQDSVMM